MSNPDMRPPRTWYEIAIEILKETDPKNITKLAGELDSAIEGDEVLRRSKRSQPQAGN
jgi:hypothetical protein